MKTKKLIGLNVFILIVIVVLFKSNKPVFYEHDEIPKSIVKETDTAVNEIFNHVQNSEYDDVYLNIKDSVFTGQSEESIHENMRYLNDILNGRTYKKIGEYYGKVMHSQNVYMTNFPFYDDYRAKIRVENKECYKYYLVEDDLYDYVITLKLSHEIDWRLVTLSIGISEVFNRGVGEWISDAEQLKSEGYYLSALLSYYNAELSTSIPHLGYIKHGELSEEKRLLEERILEQFPLKVEIPTGLVEVHEIGYHYNIERDEVGYTLRYITTRLDEYTVEAIENEAAIINEYLLENKWIDSRSEYRYIAYKEDPTISNGSEENELITVTIAN